MSLTITSRRQQTAHFNLETYFKGYQDLIKIKSFINDIFSNMQVSKVSALKMNEKEITYRSHLSPYFDNTPRIINYFKTLSIHLSFTTECSAGFKLFGYYTATADINNPHLILQFPFIPKIDESNFIENVLTNAPLLIKECKKFALDNPQFGEELDLSQIHWAHLLALQDATKDFFLPKLEENLFSSIKNSIELDQYFVKACLSLCGLKDSRCKTFFFKILIEKPELVKALLSDNEETKDHWEAFTKLCTLI